VAPVDPLRDVQWAALGTLVDAHRTRGGKPVDLWGVDGTRPKVEAVIAAV
jgi:hypothetical protein